MILDCLMMESISCRHYPESDELDSALSGQRKRISPFAGSGRCAAVAENIDIKKGNMHSHGAKLAKPINLCDSCNIVFFGVQ